LVSCHVLLFISSVVAQDDTDFSKPSVAAPPHPVDLNRVTTMGDESLYGTFQSHNQKVVANQHGYFVSYNNTNPDAPPGNELRLVQSTDGGKTFQTIYKERALTAPPSLETDEDSNLYLVNVDFSNGLTHFHKFSPESGGSYKLSVSTTAPNRYATKKFSSFYSSVNKKIYFLTASNFIAFNLDGSVNSNLSPFAGAIAQTRGFSGCVDRGCLEYPLLAERP